jgi:hypothetical protein
VRRMCVSKEGHKVSAVFGELFALRPNQDGGG